MTGKNGGYQTGSNPEWVVEAVRRIQKGKDGDRSFQQLYDHYFDYARRFLIRQGMEPSTAEDLAQNVMVRVYYGIEGFRWQSSFNTWTLRIVSNVYLSHQRHLKTAGRQAESESVEHLLDDDAAGHRLVPDGLKSSDADPLDITVALEQERRLDAALAALPPRMQQCFLMRYQGFKYREIARALDIKVDTVKKHLTAGRKRLRPVLEGLMVLWVAISHWIGG